MLFVIILFNLYIMQHFNITTPEEKLLFDSVFGLSDNTAFLRNPWATYKDGCKCSEVYADCSGEIFGITDEYFPFSWL